MLTALLTATVMPTLPFSAQLPHMDISNVSSSAVLSASRRHRTQLLRYGRQEQDGDVHEGPRILEFWVGIP